MMNLAEMWEKLTARRYTRMLEGEVERLRAENRALVNSIIGVAGIPPLKIEAEVEAEQDRRRWLEKAKRGQFGVPLNRLRKRSWQQIGRMLEMEEVKKLGHRESAVTMQPAVRS